MQAEKAAKMIAYVFVEEKYLENFAFQVFIILQ